ncbi:MAG: PEP-CTERM sorting domain-containing protein [Planctomycetes bacterium]|nr:PEP-CTERM sorting domain-containing protein [Planctomycetota bacterium]
MFDRRILMVWAGLFLFLSGSAFGDVVFTENWSGDTGHNGSNLNNWVRESSYGNGTVSDIGIISGVPGYGNILSMNPPNRPSPPYGPSADYAVGIRSKSSYSAAQANTILTIGTQMQLLEDGGGAGVVAFARSAAEPLYGYGLAVSRADRVGGGYKAVMEIRKFTGSLDSTGFGYETVSAIDPTNINYYQLEATFNAGGSIDFKAYYNGTQVAGLDYSETTNPVGFNDSVVFALATNIGQHAYFDNFAADGSPVPEPLTLFGLGIGGMILIRRRKVQRKA